MSADELRPPDGSACRTILFGGTFDPVHNAHLRIVRAAAARFPSAEIVIIPADKPPHKTRGPHASFADRVRMLEAAFPDREISRIEEGTERSYSVHTIARMLDRGPLAFLIGADAFAEIRTWFRWEDVAAMVHFIVVTRPGASYSVPAGASITEITGIAMPDSSSEVRRMIAAASPDPPVPAAVLAYIREHALYRSRDIEFSPTDSTRLS